ncbi:ABC transporter substrate-binding protein [Pseudolabrys taiwanensis]|uniref:ABC transporter substrate-binding protein n=1 Tax=Pseudolabrys taiwanensis TaxID=331696 RepID=A0A345ZSP9_9HYPH|nr:transporter substrate-binding domain-containing protein [Pseudolabrys taiwanensis]AXK79946.1 ABC transporter substrate-binding protein [Pseudolabrys taiwanensis]
MKAPNVARLASALVALLLAVSAHAADADFQQVLAPSGKLRAALYPGTPTSVVDTKEAQPRGVGYELGRALASKLGVPYEPVIYAKNSEVLEAVKTGKADVAFTNASPARQKEMDFGPAYLLIELGYLVPANSAVKTSADVDEKGRKIGVTANSTSDATLSRTLKNAEVVRAPTVGAGAEMLAAGKIDAFATNKATLFKMAEKVPGSHVLSDRWGEEHHAIARPHGRDQGADFINAFTKEALASGLVKDAMDRAGLKGAIPATP